MSEATFICCDSSSYLRNGDFRGTRWQIMKNVVDSICSKKKNEHFENSLGIILMK